MSATTVFEIIQPAGILTTHTSTEINQQFQKCLEQGIKTVLIDLKAVNFIDSSGLGVLVSLHTKLRLAGGNLYLCSAQEQAQKLFEIADMESVFTSFNSREEFLGTIVNKNQAVLVQ